MLKNIFRYTHQICNKRYGGSASTAPASAGRYASAISQWTCRFFSSIPGKPEKIEEEKIEPKHEEEKKHVSPTMDWVIVDYTKNSKRRQLQRSSLILSLRQYCYVNVRWLHVKPTSRDFNEQMTVDFLEEPERDELNLNIEKKLDAALQKGLLRQSNELVKLAFETGLETAKGILLPEIMIRDKEVMIRDEKLKQNNIIMRRIVPFLSIRNKIEVFELIVAPDLISPKAVFKDLQEELAYHEAKWRKIVQRKSDPAVVRLNSLLDEFGIEENLGCRRVGTFFSVASAKIHIPPLSSYTEEEMIKILQNDFEINDPVTLNFVRVLMRL